MAPGLADELRPPCRSVPSTPSLIASNHCPGGACIKNSPNPVRLRQPPPLGGWRMASAVAGSQSLASVCQSSLTIDRLGAFSGRETWKRGSTAQVPFVDPEGRWTLKFLPGAFGWAAGRRGGIFNSGLKIPPPRNRKNPSIGKKHLRPHPGPPPGKGESSSISQ